MPRTMRVRWRLLERRAAACSACARACALANELYAALARRTQALDATQEGVPARCQGAWQLRTFCCATAAHRCFCSIAAAACWLPAWTLASTAQNRVCTLLRRRVRIDSMTSSCSQMAGASPHKPTKQPGRLCRYTSTAVAAAAAAAVNGSVAAFPRGGLLGTAASGERS